MYSSRIRQKDGRVWGEAADTFIPLCSVKCTCFHLSPHQRIPQVCLEFFIKTQCSAEVFLCCTQHKPPRETLMNSMRFLWTCTGRLVDARWEKYSEIEEEDYVRGREKKDNRLECLTISPEVACVVVFLLLIFNFNFVFACSFSWLCDVVRSFGVSKSSERM